MLRTLRDRGTVTATAEALLMTPSAVSQQLTNLARQLGVDLLEAQGRRVRLTDAAHLVLRHAEAVFAQLERADAELTGYLRGETGEVRVGAFSTAVPALVVPAVRLLCAEDRPGPDVRVREAEAAQAYELLTAGEVDLALSLAAHAPTARDPRFRLFPLLVDPLTVALPAGHPLAGAPALRLADLAADRWIFGGSGPWSEITARGRTPRGRPLRRSGEDAPRAVRAATRWPPPRPPPGPSGRAPHRTATPTSAGAGPRSARPRPARRPWRPASPARPGGPGRGPR
nr:LysR family transcriptional regulator [Streptomyces anulatus]